MRSVTIVFSADPEEAFYRKDVGIDGKLAQDLLPLFAVGFQHWLDYPNGRPRRDLIRHGGLKDGAVYRVVPREGYDTDVKEMLGADADYFLSKAAQEDAVKARLDQEKERKLREMEKGSRQKITWVYGVEEDS